MLKLNVSQPYSTQAPWTIGGARAAFPRIPKTRARRGHRHDVQTSAFNNHIGVHALVFSGDWSPDGCARAVLGARKAGFDLIEVPLFDPDNLDAEMTKRELEFNEIRASTSLGLPDHADIASEDSEVVRRGVELLTKAVEKTDEIGAKYLVGVIMSAMKKYPGPCTPAARANVVASLREIAGRAADRGITLGLEVVNRYETNVMNTASEAMALLADIDRPNVTVHLDTYHMNIEEASMAHAVRTCGDKLGYVHIGESHRGYLGTGSVDLKGMFEALVDVGYQGPITFESFSAAVVSKDLSNTLCVWREMWTDSDELAAHSRMYIEAELFAARRKLLL